MNKKTIITFFFLAIYTFLSAQQKNTESNNCFDSLKIEPGFIALTTNKNSNLKDWYKKVFNLKTVKKFSFPDGNVTGEIMRNKEFAVEIFHRNDILDPKKYEKKAQLNQWKGILKFGVYTNANLKTLKKCLINKGIKAGRIFNDTNLGIDLLHITDPEENSLEIISRIKH